MNKVRALGADMAKGETCNTNWFPLCDTTPTPAKNPVMTNFDDAKPVIPPVASRKVNE